MIGQNFDSLAWSEPGMVQGIVLWIFLISAAVAVIALIAGLRSRGEAHPVAERTLDIVTTPNAKGAIGREHYEDITRELQS